MQKEMTVVVLGIWLIVLPFLGIPHSSGFFSLLLVLTGLGVLIVGLLLRSEVISRGRRHLEHSSYVENVPHHHAADSARVVHDFTDEGKEGINSLN